MGTLCAGGIAFDIGFEGASEKYYQQPAGRATLTRLVVDVAMQQVCCLPATSYAVVCVCMPVLLQEHTVGAMLSPLGSPSAFLGHWRFHAAVANRGK